MVQRMLIVAVLEWEAPEGTSGADLEALREKTQRAAHHALGEFDEDLVPRLKEIGCSSAEGCMACITTYETEEPAQSGAILALRSLAATQDGSEPDRIELELEVDNYHLG